MHVNPEMPEAYLPTSASNVAHAAVIRHLSKYPLELWIIHLMQCFYLRDFSTAYTHPEK